MMNCKKVSITEKRKSPLYTSALLLHGNNKLLDYTDDNGNAFKYAQCNTRALVDCPFKSAGCAAVCYATKGNHSFPSVKNSREKSYQETRRADFAEAMIYTIETEKTSARYASATMLVRVHESGDFYSVQYLRKWVKVWKHFNDSGRADVVFIFYTKSFAFFNMLDDTDAETIRRAQKDGRLAISCSLDDTTTSAQRVEYLKMIARFPLCNTYTCTEKPEEVVHDEICECANCAKCGTCNKSTGKKTVVKIHSASGADLKEYRAHVTK